MAGNMRVALQRNFLTTDGGEKPDRNRDQEVRSWYGPTGRRFLKAWEQGWEKWFF